MLLKLKVRFCLTIWAPITPSTLRYYTANVIYLKEYVERVCHFFENIFLINVVKVLLSSQELIVSLVSLSACSWLIFFIPLSFFPFSICLCLLLQAAMAEA